MNEYDNEGTSVIVKNKCDNKKKKECDNEGTNAITKNKCDEGRNMITKK